MDQVIQNAEEHTSIKPNALEQLRHRARLAHAQSKLERLEREKSEMALALTKQERLLVEERAKMNQEQEAKNIIYKEYAELRNEFNQYQVCATPRLTILLFCIPHGSNSLCSLNQISDVESPCMQDRCTSIVIEILQS